MTYTFRPQHTPAALQEIRALLPMEGRREPATLLELFRMLSQIDLKALKYWSERLSEAEFDLLCRFYHRAKTPHVPKAIAIILAHRNDRRCAQVAHFFVLLVPDRKDLEEMAHYWRTLSMAELAAGDLPWLGRLMTRAIDDIREYVKQELLEQRLTVDALEGRFHQETPLFRQLYDFMFKEAGPLLANLHPERAATQALYYLKNNDADRVRTYLEHYPSQYWKPEFLDGLYEREGAVDPTQHRFFLPLPEGTLWRTRTALFGPRMEGMDSIRHSFWERWLHRCTDWRWIQGIAHIWVPPFKIVEEPNRSIVFWAEDVVKPIEKILCDQQWETRMETLFTEYIHGSIGVEDPY